MKKKYKQLPKYWPGRDDYTNMLPTVDVFATPKPISVPEINVTMPENMLIPYSPIEYTPKMAKDLLAAIKNTRKNTSTKGGVNINNLVTSGLAFAGDVMNAFGPVKSTNELMADAGTSNANFGGFGYTSYNDIDLAQQRAELRKENNGNMMKTVGSGAALGATFGPVGAVVGGAVGAIAGLFGRSRRKRKLQRQMAIAQDRTNRKNIFARSGAMTDYLQQQYASEFGDTEEQILWGAKEGKDDYTMLPNNFNPADNVYTSVGKVTSMPNARVAKGESIIDNIDDVDNATATVVKDGKVGKDTNLANLGEGTIVLGGQTDWRTGKSFKHEALPYAQALEKINRKYEYRIGSKPEFRGKLGKSTDELLQMQVNQLKTPILEKLKDLADQLKYQHELEGIEQMRNYKCGKDRLPGFKKGGVLPRASWLSNFTPHFIGGLGSLYQYWDAARQDVKSPEVYAENPFEGAALRGLAEIKENPYPVLELVYNAGRIGNYELQNSGGLSGALKYLGRIANTNATMGNISKYLSLVYNNNLKYQSDYFTKLLNSGLQNAQRRQAANQFKEEYYASAHASKQQGKQMGMRNLLDYLNSYASNEYTRMMGNGMLNLYDQLIKLDKEKNQAYIDALKNKPTYGQYVPTLDWRSGLNKKYALPQFDFTKLYNPFNIKFT